MSDKPKRPWFRFHLSTLAFTTLFASLFLAVNIRPDQTVQMGTGRFVVVSRSGWPFEYRTEAGFQRWNGAGITLDLPDASGPIVVKKDAMTRYRPLIADAAIGVFCCSGWQVFLNGSSAAAFGLGANRQRLNMRK